MNEYEELKKWLIRLNETANEIRFAILLDTDTRNKLDQISFYLKWIYVMLSALTGGFLTYLIGDILMKAFK